MQSPIMSGIFSGIGMRMLSRCAWIFAFGLRSKTSSHISESRYLRVSVSSVLRCAFAQSIFCRTESNEPAMTRNHSSVESYPVRVNRDYLIGGIWWGIIFFGGALGLAWSAFKYFRSGQVVSGLCGVFLSLLCAVVGGALVSSIFSKDCPQCSCHGILTLPQTFSHV